jgi:hypothetical protein
MMHDPQAPLRRRLALLVLAAGWPMTATAQDDGQSAEPTVLTPAIDAPAPLQVAGPPAPAEPSADVAWPALPVPPSANGFGWDALVDAYYLYNFTGDPTTQPPGLRAFDTTANNFALNYAKLGMHAETELVAVRLDIGFGHLAAIANGASRGASAAGTLATPSDTDSLYGNAFLVQQAFATIKPLTFLSIDAGKFMTWAGAETLEASKNWLYSRSLLFYGLPGFHTGLRINLAPSPVLTLSLQVVNGMNNDPDSDAHKTLGANATYAEPALGLLAAATTYLGKETGADGERMHVLFDGFLIKEMGRLSLGANADYLQRGDAHWLGIAAMGRFIVNDLFNLALRAEYVSSKNGGYIAQDGSIYEGTVQGALTVGKHYELRAEVRADLSDEAIFARGTKPRRNQVTGLLAALAYF